jgi:hypothetical protein
MNNLSGIKARLDHGLYSYELEGILLGIDEISFQSEDTGSKDDTTGITTKLRILTQAGDAEKEHTVYFPGVVLPDSIGNWVKYSAFSVCEDGSILYTSPTGKQTRSMALEDTELGRKYSSHTTIDVTKRLLDKQKSDYFRTGKRNVHFLNTQHYSHLDDIIGTNRSIKTERSESLFEKKSKFVNNLSLM